MTGVLLVTGGSRGIGAATCRLAAKAGYDVAVNYRADHEAATGLVNELTALGVNARAVQADVGTESDVERMFREVDNSLGGITALVNSAGFGRAHMPVAEFDCETLELLLRVNVVGTMLCCREAAKRMSTDRGGKGGSIVNISSMAATVGGRPGDSAYAASKAAVDSFSVGFAKEVGTQGIRVNTVRPGVTLTDMTAAVRDNDKIRAAIESTIAMNRTASPDEIAAPVMWLLSPEASFVSGASINASGGGFIINASTSGD